MSMYGEYHKQYRDISMTYKLFPLENSTVLISHGLYDISYDISSFLHAEGFYPRVALSKRKFISDFSSQPTDFVIIDIDNCFVDGECFIPKISSIYKKLFIIGLYNPFIPRRYEAIISLIKHENYRLLPTPLESSELVGAIIKWMNTTCNSRKQ